MRFLRRIINFFKNSQPLPSPRPISVENRPKVGLVVGHLQIAQGARAHNGVSEYQYWLEVAQRVTENINNENICIMSTRDGTNIRGAIDRASSADIIIELHFNAFNGSAHGAECLVRRPSDLAHSFLNQWSQYATIRNRGVKVVTSAQAGFASVDQIARRGKQGFLFEAFFGDNPSDYRDMDKVINFLTSWILKTHEGKL